MPHWTQTKLSPEHHKDFILKYFPDKWNLYKSFSHQEERDNLIAYLWLYLNGGVYIASEYEVVKSLESILSINSHADLYFMYDDERYISPKFMVSQPFCGFWMEVINLMDKRKNHKYPLSRDQIDRNTGRGLLTDVLDETSFKYEIIPRNQLDPYRACDRNFNDVSSKESCLLPSNRNQDFMTYMSCKTGTSNELLYVTGAIIFVIAIMVIIALMTR
jgi:mannosyltransferase OCH1-like enzyme